MEIEAKFVIPDRDTAARLQRVVKLGPFIPSAPSLRRVQDRYLDTGTWTLYLNGYTCRFRHQDGERSVTIKGLGGAESAVHRRFEVEHTLPAEANPDPNTWPDWEGRELVCSFVGEAALGELFVVEQERVVRKLTRDGTAVAEMSLDQVEIRAGERQQAFWTLEIELKASGAAADLELLVQHLTRTWGLAPEPRSKYDWGLALLDQAATGRRKNQERLSIEERSQLLSLLARAERKSVRGWVQIVLGWDRGVPVRYLAAQIGLSRSWSYELLRRFRLERLPALIRCLPAEAPQVASGELQLPASREEVTNVEKPDSGPGSRPPPASMTVEEMCQRFQVDMDHARYVAQQALALFDATTFLHKLGSDQRRLLEIMGIVHNVGVETDPDRHHVAGRDILLENPLAGLTDIQQHMVAAATFLHRKRITRKRLGAQVVTSLPPGTRRDALVLAALLRMADGLDYAQKQTSLLGPIQVTPAAILAPVTGPSAEVNATRAQAKADLWDRLFDVPLVFSIQSGALAEGGSLQEAQEAPEEPAAVEAVTAAASAKEPAQKSPDILPHDVMSEAGRKVLYLHLLRMLAHEPGTRAGTDIEQLHDMRVATRRMRAAFQVFRPYFKPGPIRPYIAGLRRTARVLGQARDLDVLMEKAQQYLATLPAGQAHDLDPLLELWQNQRDEARQEMIVYLEGAKYRDFVQAFSLFLETSGAGARTGSDIPPKPVHVSHVVPQLVYARWGQVQAFETLLHGAPIAVLHALRIECKRLRYALEFFEKVLGPEAGQVIAEVTQLQDHLGNLNDAAVANALLSSFLFGSQGKAPSEPVIAPGVVGYLAAKQRELETLVRTFPQTWERFNRPEVRHWLASAVAVL